MKNYATLTSKTAGKGIFAWCLYDWANSAFATIVTTFIIAAYFTTKVATDTISGTAQWGYTITLSGIGIAVFSPLFGAIADHFGRRKPWLMVCTTIAITATGLLWFVQPSPEWTHYALTCIIVSTIGFEVGMVFYNAMLHDIVPKNYYGRVSGWGWGLGYLGGLCCLILALAFVNMADVFGLDKTTAEHIRISGPLVAIWFAIFATPLLVFTPDQPKQTSLKNAITCGLNEFVHSLKVIAIEHKNVLLFLIAHMIYIDGMNTIFAFGGIYAAGTFGFTTTSIIILGITLNTGAGLGAIGFAWLDDWLGPKTCIMISLAGLLLSGIFLLIVTDVTHFWIIACLLCIFVGPVQASSRSFLAHIAPDDRVTECFGLYAFSGKATAFLGPWLFGLATKHFHSQRGGMATVMFFLALGAFLLYPVKPAKRR